MSPAVAAVSPTAEIRKAAAAVFAAADAAAADAAAAATWHAVQTDAAALEAGQDLTRLPLWPGENPLEDLWHTTREDWSRPGSPYAFWRRWYESLLAATPMNPDLLYQIALIDNDIWEKGAEAVAEEIARIEAEHAGAGAGIDEDAIEKGIARTPYGEVFDINPATGKARATVETGLPADVGDYAARKLAAARGLFDADTYNQYTALTPELDLLATALAARPRHPVELYDTCGSVLRRLALRVEIGDLPDPAKDPVLADFRHRVLEAATDILAHDPNTQKMKAARDAITGSDVLEAEPDLVREAVAEIAAQTEGAVREALPRDAQTATNPDADLQDRRNSAYRLASRVLRIVSLALKWATIGTVGATAFAASVAALADSPSVAGLIKLLHLWIGF